MDNMELYNSVRAVPKTAQKTISAGRLKGMTDINPMWRIQALTERFGPCGIGWKYEIIREWIEASPNTKEASAFMDINLYYKYNGEWSEAVPGTGGSTFISSEKSGLHMSDECYKMALTDAISVACKALGFGADVYWDAGRSKYTAETTQAPVRSEPQRSNVTPIPTANTCADCGCDIPDNVYQFSLKKYGTPLCRVCQGKHNATN